MFQKIMLPLDGSVEAEEVFSHIQDQVSEDGEIILMQVIPPAKTQKVGNHIILGSQQEEVSRQEAIGYLKALTRKKKGDSRTWRCDVAISNSVSDGIVDLAGREKVDLIAMYTHDPGLLARHVKRSIAREVQRKASTEVRVIGTQELSEYIHHEAGADAKTELDTRIFKQVDVFNDLTNDQIDRVVALGQRLRVTVGETLGTGGAPARDLYVILEGEAHLTTHCEAGEISVRISRPGEAFPLAALLGSGTLITSGEALSDMEVLAIPRSELLKLCERDKEIGMRVYASIGRLFSNRYAETLTHLAISAERELREAGA